MFDSVRTEEQVEAGHGPADPPLLGALRFPEGTVVRGRSLRRGLPPGPRPDLGLYLTSPRARRRSRFSPSWDALWVAWPDFRLPADDHQAVDVIVAAFERARAGERVEVACGGGTGRTGTVLTCMAMLAGVAPERALHFVRRHYRPRAVETRGQRRWIERFAERTT